jgi:hypothetical protein
LRKGPLAAPWQRCATARGQCSLAWALVVTGYLAWGAAPVQPGAIAPEAPAG